ncbi:MAG: hypothetical protein ACYDEE_14510 [Ignavibacteriaceae bacterium]
MNKYLIGAVVILLLFVPATKAQESSSVNEYIDNGLTFNVGYDIID